MDNILNGLPDILKLRIINSIPNAAVIPPDRRLI
jgi:hypothetical protein